MLPSTLLQGPAEISNVHAFSLSPSGPKAFGVTRVTQEARTLVHNASPGAILLALPLLGTHHTLGSPAVLTIMEVCG